MVSLMVSLISCLLSQKRYWSIAEHLIFLLKYLLAPPATLPISCSLSFCSALRSSLVLSLIPDLLLSWRSVAYYAHSWYSLIVKVLAKYSLIVVFFLSLNKEWFWNWFFWNSVRQKYFLNGENWFCGIKVSCINLCWLGSFRRMVWWFLSGCVCTEDSCVSIQQSFEIARCGAWISRSICYMCAMWHLSCNVPLCFLRFAGPILRRIDFWFQLQVHWVKWWMNLMPW